MRAQVIVGDCRVSMATLADASVDAVVCDPPYELGFMGKAWDSSGIAFDLEVWRQALRVLKPGGHLLAFSGSRTYHRMACAIDDAGFEIRDQIMWVYGTGFPKSLDVSKAIDKTQGIWRGRAGSVVGPIATMSGSRYEETPKEDPICDDARRWSGWGTALKPAHEPICMARKPLEGTVVRNVLRHGTGAINIHGCRVAAGEGDDFAKAWDKPVRSNIGAPGGRYISTGKQHTVDLSANKPIGGRWPANFMHDGSDEATAGLREAARFFYTPKAAREDRDEMLGDLQTNMHTTVKPTDLMRYLVRMVTPPGGTVLDPFTGSGSTGRAAMLEGAQFIGCELSPEYAEIARARIRYTLGALFAHEVE